MPDRTFLAVSELDQIIDYLADQQAMPISTLDQVDAATRDMGEMAITVAATATARGDHAFLGVLPEDLPRRKAMMRPRLRMMLAAFGAGVTSLCEHTQQIRPLLLSCDPPTLVCMQPACLAKVDRNAQQQGFRWDHHCDGCGKPTDVVFPYMTTLGPLSISGHLCEPCSTEMASAAQQLANETTARKALCPCGSGRRFKRCHGRSS
ncbi:SEC-C metal-binding domain-containing protein [Streptomyces sp. NPDC048556]|uniref:YecA family protein n=1 Tax=Streptomyces sp. NPDC048556 TaxID=3156664 RepID=UPI00343BC1D2